MNEKQKTDIAEREEEALAFWREHDIFKKSLEKESPNGEYIFYDGPPFATGLPHYGHILAGAMKDAIPRFWTMNGYRVPRRWGWDCHGLPVENLIEKKLGLATKRDIESYGIKKFNESARDSVLEYADEWKKIVPRMGRFVDMEHDYRTMNASYIESVWWVFSVLHKKGLVYEDFKSMHLCPRCGTTLSNFEVNLGYKDVKDIAVTVKFPLLGQENTTLLAWTTTPWTLPGNMAVAVNNDIVYGKVKIKKDDTHGAEEYVILAKERIADVLGDRAGEIVDEFHGSRLVGMTYIPPFDYFQKRDMPNKENAWKVWHGDFVEEGEEGTGMVHIAPAYGEDDMNLAKEHVIPVVHHVDTDGHFMDFVTDWAGYVVKPKDDAESEVSHLDTDIEIVRSLNTRGLLFKKENITHSYPHCWRCETPLLNYGTTSWFIEVTKIKDALVAENKKIRWVPDHIGEGRFGKWLEGARDWAVSRQRYWGAPMPIWRNKETKEYRVIGSLDELKSLVPRSGNEYFLMRHGEGEHNVLGIASKYSGEYHLTEKGLTEVREQVNLLKSRGITKIYASPLLRGKETAETIASDLGVALDHIVYDDRLSEFDFGDYDGKPLKEFTDWRDAHTYTDIIPGGESLIQAKKRFGSFLYEKEHEHKNERALIITHGIGFETLAAVARGANMDESYNLIAVSKAKPAEVRTLNFVPIPHNDNYELDFHRPYIDEIELRDSDNNPLMRVPDVFDCWFESGAMPYAQQHYPFENTDTFEPNENKGFPAHFIAEGLDQTRGWFYSLLVLGTAIFGKSPYQNVIVNGLVLTEDGRKMSKSLRNYPDPVELVDQTGADAMRLYLMTSPIVKAEDLNFSEKSVVDTQRKTIGRLHNVLQMYELYADGTEAHDRSEQVLDRWIIAVLHNVARAMTEGFKSYELDKASRPIFDIIDDLSVWYVRRSRDRLKGDDGTDKQATLATLRYVLKTMSLLMAPVMPFYAEYLWQRVRGTDDAESVHLAEWPHESDIDGELLSSMCTVREVVTRALEARTKAGIKVRQPLQTLKVPQSSMDSIVGNDEIRDACIRLISDEVNVKEVVFSNDVDGVWLDETITPELKREGDVRELVRAIQDARKETGLVSHDKISLTVPFSLRETVAGFEREIQRIVGAETLEVSDVVDQFTIKKVS